MKDYTEYSMSELKNALKDKSREINQLHNSQMSIKILKQS